MLGDNVVLGGQVGIADHLTIGEGAMVGAKSGVASHVPAGENWLGSPACRATNSSAPPLRCGGEFGQRTRRTPAMNEVAADVMAIIAKRLPADRHDLSMTDRLDELGIDSFTAVEMIFDLEEKFDIQIPFNANEQPTHANLRRLVGDDVSTRDRAASSREKS